MNANVESVLNSTGSTEKIRHDWTVEEVKILFKKSFSDLIFEAQTMHREFFNPNQVQVSTLLSIKTGRCPEDCGYCPQSVRFNTKVETEALLPLDEVIEKAKQAKANGSSRFCMGAAWRSPKDKDLEPVIEMVKAVKLLGLETCVTLGMLNAEQSVRLKEAGLDYYNHNLDTSPEYYGDVITTRTYQDRLDTIMHVRDAGMNVCCGGILGMGEAEKDRYGLMQQLANLEHHPDSVPINLLVKVEGTPLADSEELDPIEFVRAVAVARIMMPKSHVRLSAGRENMSDEMQALCFLAGANSIFYGEKLLTTPNPSENTDKVLFDRLGIMPV
ncbi:Biotin synthase [hydrothermal vent metagenome]|uniref:biotin synthase n=1 Tax=hydrothermal vent metagenome TaxID=652676 RepID=A0A3B1AR45_9ZZZZ